MKSPQSTVFDYTLQFSTRHASEIVGYVWKETLSKYILWEGLQDI